MLVTGFIVVRRPDQQADLALQFKTRRVGNLAYEGVQRYAWGDVEEGRYFSHTLPQEIEVFIKTLKKRNADPSGIEVSSDLDATRDMLNYANRVSVRSEIIAVRSPRLSEIKGSVDTEAKIEWMGSDIYELGNWSLVRSGIFTHPTYFAQWLPKLNKHGLFDDESMLDSFVDSYRDAAEAGIAEPACRPGEEMDAIAVEVGKVF